MTTTPHPEDMPEREALHAAIREAGGIVHRDGNIFFTNAEQIAKVRNVIWLDEQGATHSVSVSYAAELLKQMFDEWPDGMNEIEAAMGWRDREIERLTSEASLAEQRTRAMREALRSILDQFEEDSGWGRADIASDELEAALALISTPPSAPGKGEEGYRVFKDGTAWCAVGPDFVNAQESLCAFNDTPYRALELLTEMEGEQKRREKRAAIDAAMNPGPLERMQKIDDEVGEQP